jgi:hypothetical protein
MIGRLWKKNLHPCDGIVSHWCQNGALKRHPKMLQSVGKWVGKGWLCDGGDEKEWKIRSEV